MERAPSHPLVGTPYIPSRSLGRWQSAAMVCLFAGLLSGLLYAFCLMSSPVRWCWTTRGFGGAPIVGTIGALCAMPAVALAAIALARFRVAAPWMVRLLTIALGVVVALTCFIALLGQAPLGSEAPLAGRPVPFRDISLGAGALEVLRELPEFGDRFTGLRAVAATDKQLFAGVFFGALICAAIALDLSYRAASYLTSAFMLDERSGYWFDRATPVMDLQLIEGRDPTYADFSTLLPADPERGAEQTTLVLLHHESDESLESECVLCSITEVSIQRKGPWLKKWIVWREAMPPTYVGAEEFQARLEKEE